MKKKTKRKTPPTKKVPPEKRPLQGMNKRWLLIAAAAAILLALAGYLMRTSRPVFDGQQAFAFIEEQCRFGPRLPGSAEHQRCGDFLVAELSRHADRVWEHTFTYTHPRDGRSVPGRNILASFNLQPQNPYRVLLCAHWDTRPHADLDPEPANRTLPVPGANDGASGVAVLLEMARLLKASPLDFGVDIILFDLEDMGEEGSTAGIDSLVPFCIGSQRYVDDTPNYRPRYGILLDMIGDRDLRIPQEEFSRQNAGYVVNKVWAAARRVNASAFVDEPEKAIMDDHVAFLQKGIPVIDLIDFDYPYWHTLADTPDKCSAASLQQVGDVLVEVLYGKE